jgi:hypothetical protein
VSKEEKSEGRVRSILKRIFKKGHPDLYRLLQQKAEEQGVTVEDLLAAGASAIISSTDKGAEELAQLMRERREGSGKDESEMFIKVMDKYSGVMDTMVNSMVKIQEAGQKLVRGSLLNEVKGTFETAESIKSMGAEGGGGGLLDKVAGELIGNILTGKLGISPAAVQSAAQATAKKTTGASSGRITTIDKDAEVK